jgi:hypothetical protein
MGAGQSCAGVGAAAAVTRGGNWACTSDAAGF